MSKGFAQIGLRSAVVFLSVVLTVLVLAVAILPRPSAASDNHPMNVRGYVYDDHGNKIANANVTVTMYNGGTAGVTKTTISNKTSDLGYFSVNFAIGEWASLNTILVTAEYRGGLQGTNETNVGPVVDGNDFFEWKNVSLPYEISQFGNMTGLLLTAGLVGVVAAVALVWRRKAK